MRDVVESQQILETAAGTSQVAPTATYAAKSAISRSDISTDAKILVLEGSRTLFGFKALLRLSDRAFRDRGEIFFQPHSTEIIWGGQRVIFIFPHASGAFGFYYDIQLNELLSIPPGGRSFETMTIAVNNAIFILFQRIYQNTSYRKGMKRNALMSDTTFFIHNSKRAQFINCRSKGCWAAVCATSKWHRNK
jgi:hypothetical protein